MSRKIKDHKARQRAIVDMSLADDGADGQKNMPARAAKRLRAQPRTTDAPDDEAPAEAAREWSAALAGGGEESDDDAAAPLPVIGKGGKWKAVPKAAAAAKATAAEAPVAEAPGAEAAIPSKEGAPRRTLAEARRELATLAIRVTEDATENAASVKEILDFVDLAAIGRVPAHAAEDVAVARVALLTAVAVIKDILPGYAIRPPSEAEAKAIVSKEVLRVRAYEATILTSYTRLLALLRAIVQPPRKRRAPRALVELLPIAASCVAQLMLFAGHFNLFDDVLTTAVLLLSLSDGLGEPGQKGGAASPAALAVTRIVAAFDGLFAGDASGRVTFLALRLISNQVKERQYSCAPAWLEALRSVQLRYESPHTVVPQLAPGAGSILEARRKKGHLSGRKRKEHREQRAEMQKMAEAEETVSKEERQRWNSESTKHLFRIYFGILKCGHSRALLPPLLEGLSRHAGRVSIEYFSDLLHSLRTLLTASYGGGEEPLDVTSMLHCILTVDRIYAINENLAAMDLKHFYIALFAQLPRIASHMATAGAKGGATAAEAATFWAKVSVPLQQCLTSLFHAKRHVPAVRTAAFLQRMADAVKVLMQARETAGCAAFFLENMRNILAGHRRGASVLDVEPFGQGAYAPSCSDPDLCNPFARSLYTFLLALKAAPAPHGPDGKIIEYIGQILRLAPDAKEQQGR